MGAGKTTVARLVGERLGWPSFDTDQEVERRSGASVSTLFATEGEAAFRRLEADVLRDVLARPTPTVVSVGGGAVLDAANRSAMAGAGTVVWLRARPETLVRRVGTGRGRPLLADDAGPPAALERIEAERRAVYAELADEVVDVDHLGPTAVARRVLDAVGTTTERPR